MTELRAFGGIRNRRIVIFERSTSNSQSIENAIHTKFKAALSHRTSYFGEVRNAMIWFFSHPANITDEIKRLAKLYRIDIYPVADFDDFVKHASVFIMSSFLSDILFARQAIISNFEREAV